MDTAKIREEISKYLQYADDRVLKLIHGLIKADQTSPPVGNNPDGIQSPFVKLPIFPNQTGYPMLKIKG
ncbi:MAG: hypothetical protein WD398_15410 [Cyclobacteriaceae bacterium]